MKPEQQGAGGQGEKVDPKDQLPGDKQGQNPSEQKSQGNEGGESQGADKTDKGQKSKTGQGEKKEPGAGESGDEGAGKNSTDKTGNGQGQESNRDKNKTTQSDSATADGRRTEPAQQQQAAIGLQGRRIWQRIERRRQERRGPIGRSGRQRQRGQQERRRSGCRRGRRNRQRRNGLQGRPQKKRLARRAKAATSRAKAARPNPAKRASKSGSPIERGQRIQRNRATAATSPAKAAARRPVVGGGGDGDRPQLDPTQHPEAEAADEANLEYARKATEMVLQKLKDQEHNPDPELLDKLGWSQEDLAEFLRRWDALQKSADKTARGPARAGRSPPQPRPPRPGQPQAGRRRDQRQPARPPRQRRPQHSARQISQPVRRLPQRGVGRVNDIVEESSDDKLEANMPDLVITNIPHQMLDELQQRATVHQRTPAEEAKSILHAALANGISSSWERLKSSVRSFVDSA